MGEETHERLGTEYKNLSKRFEAKGNDYTKQYCSIYNVRLKKMRNLLQDRLVKKWGRTYPICELHKLAETDHPKCIVIGTLFKDQKLKPSVLKQLAEANSLVPQPVYTHYTDDSDLMFIEDELQRFQVVGAFAGDFDKTKWVTGISCALLGRDLGQGKFEMEDYCFADLREQIERPLLQEDIYVIFVSGLDLVHIQKSLSSLKLFCNWISGHLGNINGINVAAIVRVIIAGNSSKTSHEKSKPTLSLTSRSTELPEIAESVKLLDAVLLELAQVIDVDVMPGEHDPSNHILPQQPMHHCMLPRSAAYKSLNRVTNPYECEIGGVRILGSSGQPVLNILGFCDIEEPIEALESCLRWSHVAPTAPDTLGCYPFYDSDPFIIDECPHVLFAGNQEKFNTKTCQGEDGQEVRLICVPEFVTSWTVTVLNLKNLDCIPISFKIL